MNVTKQQEEVVQPPPSFIIELDEEEARVLRILGGFIDWNTEQKIIKQFPSYDTSDVLGAIMLVQEIGSKLSTAGEVNARWLRK